MKIKILEDEKIVLYLYDYFFNTLEKDQITKEIKKIFLKLIKYYEIEMGGIYEVFVYENKKYGTILEIIKKEQLLFHPDLIDIKLKIFNIFIYLKSCDYFLFKEYQNVYFDGKYFYIDVEEVSNLLPLIEWVDICYFKKNDFLNSMLKIK